MGIRTLVLTNATGAALAREQALGQRYNEVWQHYPDVPGFGVQHRAGDPRAAMAPAVALAALGANFSWLLYGDDDVAFFWPGVLRALQGLDPRDPYFLTDNVYGHYPDSTDQPRMGKLDQPRCVPCTLDTTGLDLEAAHALKTCNCTVPVMTEGFADLLTGERQFKRFPKVTPIYAINGGAGAVFSRGLLQQIRVPQYEKCVLGRGPPFLAKCLGGDCVLTHCLWYQGFGHTDPGFELRHPGILVFDAFRISAAKMNLAFRAALQGQWWGCRPTCQLQLQHAVTLHMGGRGLGDMRKGGFGAAKLLQKAACYATHLTDLEQLASQSLCGLSTEGSDACL
ncbi:hypothetical protein ABPG75_000667 [Micractinium tetrahymenae]